MTDAGPRIQAASDHSLLVVLGDRICPAVHREVLRLSALLRGTKAILNLHPGYASILLTFDPLEISHAALEKTVRALMAHAGELQLPPPRTIEIPVRYGGESGPDLAALARLKGLTPEEVVHIHSSADYLVYFLGFAPGFPYLGGEISSGSKVRRIDA